MNKKYATNLRSYLLLFFSFLSVQIIIGQHTFSIVAVDPATGEIGSAGATCLSSEDGAQDVSDIVLGVGAINTQSFWDPTNQSNARTRMIAGDSANQIISWLQNNDVVGASYVPFRQYGVVDLNGGSPRSAAFTGNQNSAERGHRLGSNYAIQGNILISQAVLDDMETAFLNTTGPLCDKLMGAMQAAKRPGADSRCLSSNISSASAYIRVAQPTDTDSSYGNLWLDLNVWLDSGTFTGDPIDELQTQFDAFKTTLSSPNFDEEGFSIYPNPSDGNISIVLGNREIQEVILYDILGKELIRKKINGNTDKLNLDFSQFNNGVYIIKIRDNIDAVKTAKIVIQ